MIHLPNLIADLGFILFIAALVTLLFKKLGQPLVLGYLIAGFLVSPHFPWLPTVQDSSSVSIWAEIGVIFLLFGLGLEFSFKKLLKVGGAAGFTAVFEVTAMIGIGYLVGRSIGWNSTDSLFLGGIISVSSTTIIARAFQELGLKGQKFVGLVFGILVVEDIIAVMLLVILPALSVSNSTSTADLLVSVLRLIFFVLLWFILGIFVLPPFLRKIRNLLEEETTLIVALGLCLMMVIIASNAGFSPALGAFIMGSLLSETPEGHRIEHLLNPVKNLFAAVFFVSVGMMINPQILRDNVGLVLLFTFITIVGKFISIYLGAVISGQPRKVAIKTGMSLAQIGEFSFIIATLGMSLKLTSDFLYPLAVAVCAVTTFTTPYLIKSSELFYQWTDRHSPSGFKAMLSRYEIAIHKQDDRSTFGLLMKNFGIKILFNSIVIVAIIFSFKTFVLHSLEKRMLEHDWSAPIAFVLCLIISIPFFWGLVRGGPSKISDNPSDVAKVKRAIWSFGLGRLAIAGTLLTVMVAQFVSLRMASGLLTILIITCFLVAVRYGERFYKFFEKEFIKNLGEKDREVLNKGSFDRRLLPWDASISDYELGVESDLNGKTLREISFKEKYSVTIVAVIRAGKKVFAPTGDFVLWPYDKLVCFGSDTELSEFHIKLDKSRNNQQWSEIGETKFKLNSFIVTKDNSFFGKPIRESGLREYNKALVVGVERNSEKIIGPASDFILKENDLVWVVSE